MKSLLGILISAIVIAICGPGTVSAEWLPIIQFTDSENDDRNPMAYEHQGENWLFWDREIEGERQIFYRRLDFSGQFLEDEVQLTHGPGSNYEPKLDGVSYATSTLMVTWERCYNNNKDVQFAYHMNGEWSDLLDAFNSSDNETNPWPNIRTVWFGSDRRYTFLITAQKDSSICFKRYELQSGILNVTELEELSRDNPVSSPSGVISQFSSIYGIAMFFLWQESTYEDTIIYRRMYQVGSGWGDLELLDIGGLNAFNPSFAHFTTTSSLIYFSYIQNDTFKVGKLYDNYYGDWLLTPDLFSGFNGNQYDCFYNVSVFVTDINDDYDIYAHDVISSEYISLSLPGYDDLNPCSYWHSWWSWPNHYLLQWVYWESYRDGNWDILGRRSEDLFGFVEPNESELGMPDKLSISVYPNPSNAAFRISLDQAVGSVVKARIYDLSGRLVREIYNGWLPRGMQSLYWDASGQSSGIYLLRVENQGTSQSRKIVLLK